MIYQSIYREINGKKVNPHHIEPLVSLLQKDGEMQAFADALQELFSLTW